MQHYYIIDIEMVIALIIEYVNSTLIQINDIGIEIFIPT